MEHVTLLAALKAGVFSFVSPCVAPLIPGYLAFVSGASLIAGDEPGAVLAAGSRRRTLAAALAFVIGFSLVFVGLGASTTAVGRLIRNELPLLARIGGGIIILFGFHTLGVVQIGWLARNPAKPSRTPAWLLCALLLGFAFAFGWTPYVGPVLTAILFVAGTDDTLRQGVVLLTIYSLGLAAPFLLASLAVHQLIAAGDTIRRHRRAIETAAGTLLVVLGALIFTRRLTLVTQYLTPYLPVF